MRTQPIDRDLDTDASEADGTITVTVPGPVSSIEVYHSGVGGAGANISDVYFTPSVALDDTASANDGDDKIEGGAGADVMFGQGGDDTFVVSSAADGAGDVIDGGNGPDQNTDLDTLDLRGAGQVTIDETADENDAGATKGTVTFENGEVLTFEAIERILVDDTKDASISGNVFVDLNGDGQDNDNAFAPNQLVLLEDASFNEIARTMTDENGNYSFDNLPAGDYRINFEAGPYTTQDVGDDATDSDPDATGRTETITLGSGEPLDNVDAGILPGTATGTVFVDVDGNGLNDDATPAPNRLVELKDADGNVLASTTTDADGTYTFEDLIPGVEYFVDVQAGPYTEQDVGDDDSIDSDVAFNGVSERFVLQSNETIDIDAGILPASISGNLFNDVDRDGLNNDGANGLEDEPVRLFNADGVLVATTTTDANGDYSFEGLAPGTYEIDFTAAPYTVQDAGDDAIDSDVDEVNGRAEVTLGTGEDLVIDAGALRNQGPETVEDIVDVDEDGVVTFNPLANDSDPNGDALTLVDITDPANGTLVDNGDGTFTYTPDPDSNGPDKVTYTVTDGTETVTETVTFNVTPVNDGPDAVNDVATTPEDQAITIDPLVNDNDVDNDPPKITAVSVPSDQGTVEIVNNEIVFTPADDYNGPATISYAITDGNGGTDVAEIVVDVTPVNDDPVANDDIAETPVDTPVIVDLLGNDSDLDDDPLTLVNPTSPNGTVVDNGDGTVTFTPNPGYEGPAEITYTVEDGKGGQDTGTAVVNVGEGASPPVANDDTATTPEDTPVTIDVLDNENDPDSDPLTITAASVPPEQGTVEIVNNELVFTPAPDFNGPATITYAITDGNGGTDTAEVSVTVDPVNDDPIAVDDIDNTPVDTPVTD